MDGKNPNAFKELEKALGPVVTSLKIGYSRPDYAATVAKAMRIVAELAKVRCHAPFHEIPFDGDAYLAYRDCRAIAEE